MTNTHRPLQIARRAFLGPTSLGLGSIALGTLLKTDALFGADVAGHPDTGFVSSGFVNPLHLAPKAKRVIFMVMAGGMSHLETFDHKPKLTEMHGQPMPESFTTGQPIAQLQGQALKCFGPQHSFKKWGQSGQEISELFPKMGTVSDDICIVRSMKTEAINHDPAHTFMNSGTTISGRPSMGTWLTYGLGTDNGELPGFVVMTSTGKYGQSQPISSRQWSSGFIPSRFQGVEFRSVGDPVLYVGRPKGVDSGQQQDVVQAVNALNGQYQNRVDDPEVATRVAQYELAFRMQVSVPELMDVSNEPQHIFDLYGSKGSDGSFAANCLLARRLVERGVRFIQLYHRDWDHHGGIKDQIAGTAKEVDQPAMALIQDLKQRDMLKDTLLVFATEFGRTPMAQGDGRDHHMKAFSIWLSGGGIRGGITLGGTDDLGYNAVQEVVSVNDLHATMLHLLGVDHKRLTYRFQGRDFRLTDTAGEVVMLPTSRAMPSVLPRPTSSYSTIRPSLRPRGLPTATQRAGGMRVSRARASTRYAPSACASSMRSGVTTAIVWAGRPGRTCLSTSAGSTSSPRWIPSAFTRAGAMPTVEAACCTTRLVSRSWATTSAPCGPLRSLPTSPVRYGRSSDAWAPLR